eukprot:2159340-Alexandrium_andersonii.AAC.1
MALSSRYHEYCEPEGRGWPFPRLASRTQIQSRHSRRDAAQGGPCHAPRRDPSAEAAKGEVVACCARART